MSNPRNDQTQLDALCAGNDDSCPSWWGCEIRGCYERAKENYASSGERRAQPGDRGYLTTTSRAEDAIEQSVYGNGPLGKRP